MATPLVYMPVLRSRQEENKILNAFEFPEGMYPCVEIVKELDRQPVTMRKGVRVVPKKLKTFDEVYLGLLSAIKSKHVLVDIPVHFKTQKNTELFVIRFMQQVARNRKERTKYMLKLTSLAEKVIPVISTYSEVNNELNSIVLQEKDLRTVFKRLGFRTFPGTFSNDLEQIKKVARPGDYVILDIEDYIADAGDEDMQPIIEELEDFDACDVIIVKSAIPESTTNVGLEHEKVVKQADNRLLRNFALLNGEGFGDYAGVKKDKISKGGSVSPGLIFYEPVDNEYFGFKGEPKETNSEKFLEYQRTIAPAVFSSEPSRKMNASGKPFLSGDNHGWTTIKNIKDKKEPGSPAKFKGIAIDHYLHCMRTKIKSGDFPTA